jgi:hypothetical protein
MPINIGEREELVLKGMEGPQTVFRASL